MHIKQSTREKEVLERVDKFDREYGEAGQDVLRFEWRSWKRILQTSVKRKWLNTQQKPEEVFQRVYREDERSQDDFSLLCNRVAPANPVASEGADGPESMLNEYIVSVLQPDVHYSLTENASVANPDGTTTAVPKTTHFQLLGTAHGSKRPKLMQSSEVADEVALKAHLALHISHEECIEPDEGAAVETETEGKHVFAVGDTEWVRPMDLAPRGCWLSHLFHWKVGPSEHQACMFLSAPELVRNQLALTDPRCSTLILRTYLKSLGWVGEPRKVDHTKPDLAIYDNFESVRMKSYLQAVLQLSNCLKLSSHVPSRQPIRYYRLLLGGVRTEPGLGVKAYMALCDDHHKRTGKALVPVGDVIEEDPAAPVPLADDDGEDIGVPLVPVPPKPKRRRTAGPPTGGGRGRGGAAGSAHPPPICPGAPLPPVGLDESSDSDIGVPVGGASGSGGPPAGPRPPPLPPPAEGPGEDSGDDVAVPVAVAERPPRAKREDKPQWVCSFGEFIVKFDPSYEHPTDPSIQFKPNWQIRCVNREHGKACHKTRFVNESSTANFGDWEPLAYLHEWTSTPAEPGKSHGRTNPDPDRVVAYATRHSEALKEAAGRILGRRL